MAKAEHRTEKVIVGDWFRKRNHKDDENGPGKKK